MLTRCCLRSRNSRCAIRFWSRLAAWELYGKESVAAKRAGHEQESHFGFFFRPGFPGAVVDGPASPSGLPASLGLDSVSDSSCA